MPPVPAQPTTPSLAQNRDLDHNGCDYKCDQEVPSTDSKLEDSPTVGRMTNAACQSLHDGFKELDACVKRISFETGLNPVQIVERWDATKTRVASSWNIYQGFFEERREEELAQLDPKAHPLPGAIPNKSAISACYELFKLAKPDTYDDILRTWHRLCLMMDKGEMSISKRAREFKKHTEKIDALIWHASNLYGFESLCISVGGVINQDQNLAQIMGSDATVDFFDERYRSSDNSALGQMKAHVYDRLSKRMTLDSKDVSAAAVIKKEQTPVMAVGEVGVASIHDLREKFIALAARHKIAVTKGNALLWKVLPHAITEAGCVLFNWPEDVPFPCDENQSGKTTSKGISVLKQPARALLFAAFDHPTHPLCLEKKYKTSVPGDQPVIIGVPPDTSSPHAYGRCKFLDDNCNEDCGGPPRLKATATSKNSATTQKASTCTSKKKAPPLPSRKPESEAELDQPMDLVNAISDHEDDGDALKSSKNAASKSKSRVEFVIPDDSDDLLYCALEDSGTDDDLLVVRSPCCLRSKETVKKIKKNRVSTKRSVPKRRHPSADEDKQEHDGDEAASVIEVDASSVEKSPNSNKKRRVEPTAPTALIVKTATSAASTNSTAPSIKETHAGERSLTDKVAEALFGDVHPMTRRQTPDPTASGITTRPNFPPPSILSLPTASSSDVPSAPPRAAAIHAPTPHQQSEDQPHVSQLQAPRQEGYYAPHYSAPFFGIWRTLWAC